MEPVAPVAPVVIGADIGQKLDPSAVAVVQAERRDLVPAGWSAPDRPGIFTGEDYRRVAAKTETLFTCRHLERLPLDTGYPAVAARLVEVVAGVRRQAPGAPVTLVVDVTGVGRPVFDLVREALRGAGCRLTAATFTHGDRLDGRPGDREIRVGKAYLVSRLQALLQTARVRLPAGHPEAGPLTRELLEYEIKVSEDGDDKYGAFRTGAHDDLVTALGLAVIADGSGKTLRSF